MSKGTWCRSIRLRPRRNDLNLVIVRANDEEVAAHEALMDKMAQPERLSLAMRLMIRLVVKITGNPLWDNQLKEYGAYENRFARPYVD